MVDVVIAGAAGRMGCRLVALIQEEKDLRLAAAPGGEQVQADVASVHLRRGEHAYLDSVMDSAVVTIGLPVGNPLEICGISFGQ